jgi:gliding motility-associated-like protein
MRSAFLILWFTLNGNNLYSQRCIDDNFLLTYETPGVKYLAGSVKTKDNGIVLVGYSLFKNTLLRHAWITKISAQGTILWNRQIPPGEGNSSQFSNVSYGPDNTFFVTGINGILDSISNGYKYVTGILMKLDEYGNPLWQKKIDNIDFSLSQISKPYVLNNGDVLIDIIGFNPVRNTLSLLDKNGKEKWNTSIISTDEYSFDYYNCGLCTYLKNPGRMLIKQLKNGNVVLARNLSIRSINNTPLAVPRIGYYLMCMNPSTGITLWERQLVFSNNATVADKPIAQINNITELPDGDLSFLSSYAYKYDFFVPYTKQCLNIITSPDGLLKKAFAYGDNATNVYVTGGAASPENDGSQVALMDNGDFPVVLKLDAAGSIVWQKAYTLPFRSQETSGILHTTEGIYLFSYTRNGGSKDFTLVKTTVDGRIPCSEKPINFIQSDITSEFAIAGPDTLVRKKESPQWADTRFFASSNYTMSFSEVCRQTCCTDIVATEQIIDKCNATSVLLPNGYEVKTSGRYPIVLKSAKGCDSIVPYNVFFSKSPQLNLGDDRCLKGKDSVLIVTSDEFQQYTWNNTASSSYFYAVKQPMRVILSVSNACGSARDTVNVFDECEYPMYMPNVFTPNNDGLNDFFGIPDQNKNKLILLAVYNRWGQLIFSSNSAWIKWDGTYKALPSDPGLYTYNLLMETLDGKPLKKSGTITLIR